MKKNAIIDSINFSSSSFEDFFDSDNYHIITVKGIGFFNPKLWIKTFGKPLTQNIIEAKIIFTNLGLTIPLKRYAINPQMQTIEFAGLHGYNEKSKLLKELLLKLLPILKNSFIKRIDIAFDYSRVPSKIIKSIEEKRKIFPYKNTKYFKTENEKKTNTTIDIKLYNKSLKEKLDYSLDRLEFAFKGAYFDKIKLSELDKNMFQKMQKSILRFSGIDSRIIPIS